MPDPATQGATVAEVTSGDRFRVNDTAASSEYRLLLYYGVTTTMTPITVAI